MWADFDSLEYLDLLETEESLKKKNILSSNKSIEGPHIVWDSNIRDETRERKRYPLCCRPLLKGESLKIPGYGWALM